MEGIARPIDAGVSEVLRLEWRLIADAVRFVASEGAPRVTVAGLRFGDALLEGARDLAVRHGVRVVPRWAADEVGLDVTIELLDGGVSDDERKRGDRSGLPEIEAPRHLIGYRSIGGVRRLLGRPLADGLIERVPGAKPHVIGAPG